jgi:hypothetical protein
MDEYPEDDPLIAWRVWILFGAERRLASWFAPSGQRYWYAGKTQTAQCVTARGRGLAYPYDTWVGKNDDPHDVPDPECTCGIRGMESFPALAASIRRSAAGFGALWRALGPDVFVFRRRTQALNIPDVIGQVALWGRVTDDSYGDDPGTRRAQYARVGDRFYLGWHVGAAAEIVQATYPACDVVVSETPGPGWLDEIRDAL